MTAEPHRRAQRLGTRAQVALVKLGKLQAGLCRDKIPLPDDFGYQNREKSASDPRGQATARRQYIHDLEALAADQRKRVRQVDQLTGRGAERDRGCVIFGKLCYTLSNLSATLLKSR